MLPFTNGESSGCNLGGRYPLFDNVEIFSESRFFLLDSPSSSSPSVSSSSDSLPFRLRFPLSGLGDSLDVHASSASITVVLGAPRCPPSPEVILAPRLINSLERRSMESMVIRYCWSALSLPGSSLLRSKASFVVIDLIVWDLVISPFLKRSIIESNSPTIVVVDGLFG